MSDDKPHRWRTGRKNPHTIYEQTGGQPSDSDRFVGSLNTPEATALAVDAVNSVERVRTEASSILRIVNEWCVEANDVGGVDAGDLAWRLEQAGHPLPDPEESDA